MRKSEINTFIETMEEYGDIWTVDQVKDVYGDRTLEEAIIERKTTFASFADAIGKVLNA